MCAISTRIARTTGYICPHAGYTIFYMRKAKSEATEFEEWVCLNLGNIKKKFRRLHAALPRAGKKAPVREQWLVLGTSYRAFRYIVSSVVCPLRPGIAMFLMISTRFHSVGHVQNHTQGILPGMDLPIRSVSSERHSYAYPPPRHASIPSLSLCCP